MSEMEGKQLQAFYNILNATGVSLDIDYRRILAYTAAPEVEESDPGQTFRVHDASGMGRYLRLRSNGEERMLSVAAFGEELEFTQAQAASLIPLLILFVRTGKIEL